MYQDKVVWITGASSDTGEALAVEIMTRGLVRGKKEIGVSRLPERAALIIKRFFPGLLFRVMEKKRNRRILSEKNYLSNIFDGGFQHGACHCVR